MSCQFCGSSAIPDLPGRSACGTIHRLQSAFCISLRRHGDRIVKAADNDAIIARLARLESSARALLDAIDGDAEDITEAVDALRGAVEGKP